MNTLVYEHSMNILLQEETFPNQYGACECTDPECSDVFQLCDATGTQQDIFSDASPASLDGPSRVIGPPFTVYSFNGLNGISNNWLSITDSAKATFLQTATNQFSISFWLRVESGSGSSYILGFERGRSRYFNLLESSQARLIFYYFRDALPGFTPASDDGYDTQVAFSFYYNRTQLPTGLRDNQWHFISLNVMFPSVTLVIDGVQYQPTRGNYRNEFDSTVNFNQIPGVNYSMPAPILMKSNTVIDEIEARIGGSIRSTNFALFGEMRQLVLSSYINDDLYACLASCNNLIGVDPTQSFPSIVTFYNPVTRVFDFTGPINAAGYTNFLQSLIYYTNGFLPPEESGESRRVTLRINDELGIGSEARINLIGRSNQNDPLLDANGDLVAGINFMLDLREDVDDDQELQILSPRSFITDTDLDSIIVNITVNLTNPVSLSQETIRLVDSPPNLVTVTDGNGNVLGAGDGAHVIVIASVDGDGPRATANVFITALLNLRYANTLEEPMDVDRIIEFTVFDGLRTNNPRAQTIVNVIITDDIPVLDLNGGGSGRNNVIGYVESSPPTLLIEDLIVVDPDSFSFTGARAAIERVFDVGNETLALDTSMLGTTISCVPASCNGTSIIVTGSASLAAYSRLLSSLRYVNLKQLTDLPNLRDRRVFVTINDGANESDEQTNVLIDFIPLNPRVIVELAAPSQNYSVTFEEAQTAPVLCHSLVRVVDTSIDTLESVVVSIRDVLPDGITEDEEMISLTSTSDLSISIEINTALKRITFSQVSDIAQYLEAIRRVQYFNGEQEPVLVNRFVDFVVIPGGGAPSDTAECNITILSVNDNAPQCPGLDPISVPENSTDGFSIVSLEATDLDRGRDGDLTYRLIEGDASLFQVSADGEVTLSGVSPLDRETTPEYSLVVEACDNGSPQLCCQFNLTVLVQDINDNPPMFNSTTYTFTVMENQIRDFPSIFGVFDRDEGSNAQVISVMIDPDTFEVRTGCVGEFSLQVDSDNILLSTTSGLDFEVIDECNFEIVAEDGGVPSMTGRATVSVIITNQDDFPPQFSQQSYGFFVEEENQFPQVIGIVRATDRDSPSIFFAQEGLIGQFEINQTSGAVSILFSSDRAIQTVYNFTAIVRDPPGLMDTALVTVTVRPINNDPPELDLNATDTTSRDALTPALFVEEGDAVRIVTDPLVSDPDELQLTLTRITVRVANSGNPESEVLSVATDLTTPPHTILSTSLPATLIIQPQNPNSIADVISLLQSVLYANTEDELSICNDTLHPCLYGPLSRTLLFTVFDDRFTSEESAAFVVFELVNDPPLVDLDDTAPGQDFRVVFREGTDGVGIVNVAGYSITDEDSSSFLSLTCNLTNPLGSSTDNLILRGSLPTGLSLSIDTLHLLQIVGNAPATDYEAALGLLAYTSTSDNPDTTDRFVEVSVTDSNRELSNIATAIITFNTTNDPPRLDLDTASPGTGFAVTYVENSPPVELTGMVNISDVDGTTLERLTVNLTGGSGAEEILSYDQTLISSNFLLASYVYPQLTVVGTSSLSAYAAVVRSVRYHSAAPEFTTISPRVAVFTVADADGGEGTASVTINIRPVNDNDPVFVPSSVYNFTVAENSGVGTLVGVVTVADADLPQVDTPIFGISSFFNDFIIINNPADQFQGQILVNGPIDYDAPIGIQRYDFEVLAVFLGSGGNITASVTVDVFNLPDIPPAFDQCPPVYFTTENEAFNSVLNPSSCTARDPDGLDEIQYAIEGNVLNGNTLITIDPATGVLTVVDNIDREVVGVGFSVIINASDSTQFATRNISVVIQGVNEHAPSFSQASYTQSIEENEEPSSTPILQVVATDLDEAPDIAADPDFRSRITYRIVPETSGTDQYFSINSTTGEILQLLPVDYEMFPIFRFMVEASDNDASDTARQASVQVIIQITNINDEQPFFVNLPNPIIVSELTEERVPITTIRTEDPDGSNFLSVVILPPVPPQFFLTASSGILSLNSRVDAETPPREFNITLRLTDTGTDQRYQEAAAVLENTTILVEDVNDETPQFSSEEYVGMVVENSPSGMAIVNLSAVDRDYGLDPDGNSNGNNILSYFFDGQDSPPPNTFTIDSATGVIRTLRTLNREEASRYEFTVVVRDNPQQDTSLIDTARVIIDVQDVNEFSPIADPDQYFAFVSEATDVGEQIQTYAQIAWNISCKYGNTQSIRARSRKSCL